MTLLRLIVLRIAAILPLLFFLPLLTFTAMHFLPGNYFDTLKLNPQISPAVIAQYEQTYHLNEPVWKQYFYWLNNLLHLDFGFSFAYRQPVFDLLLSKLGNTLLLTVPSFVLAWTMALFLGLWSGSRPDSLGDHTLQALSYLFISTPSFFLCLLFLYAGTHVFGFPLGGMTSADHESLPAFEKIRDVLIHMIIPVSVMTIGSLGYLLRLFRVQIDEVMKKDFIFFLRVSRIPESRIMGKHVARNALNPLVTLFGLELPLLFSGAALVEIFTGWPGLGAMMLQAVRAQDLFLVLGNMVMISLLLVVGSLLSDILLIVMDPRIKMEARS